MIPNFVQESIFSPFTFTKDKKDLTSFVSERSVNVEGLMKNSISQSSYVELKLAQFARAIIGRPRILLLDNFFSDLEENMEKKINYLILALNKIGTSIIIFGPPPKGDTIKFNKQYKISDSGLIEIERKSLSL